MSEGKENAEKIPTIDTMVDENELAAIAEQTTGEALDELDLGDDLEDDDLQSEGELYIDESPQPQLRDGEAEVPAEPAQAEPPVLDRLDDADGEDAERIARIMAIPTAPGASQQDQPQSESPSTSAPLPQQAPKPTESEDGKPGRRVKSQIVVPPPKATRVYLEPDPNSPDIRGTPGHIQWLSQREQRERRERQVSPQRPRQARCPPQSGYGYDSRPRYGNQRQPHGRSPTGPANATRGSVHDFLMQVGKNDPRPDDFVPFCGTHRANLTADQQLSWWRYLIALLEENVRAEPARWTVKKMQKAMRRVNRCVAPPRDVERNRPQAPYLNVLEWLILESTQELVRLLTEGQDRAVAQPAQPQQQPERAQAPQTQSPPRPDRQPEAMRQAQAPPAQARPALAQSAPRVPEWAAPVQPAPTEPPRAQAAPAQPQGLPKQTPQQPAQDRQDHRPRQVDPVQPGHADVTEAERDFIARRDRAMRTAVQREAQLAARDSTPPPVRQFPANWENRMLHKRRSDTSEEEAVRENPPKRAATPPSTSSSEGIPDPPSKFPPMPPPPPPKRAAPRAPVDSWGRPIDKPSTSAAPRSPVDSWGRPIDTPSTSGSDSAPSKYERKKKNKLRRQHEERQKALDARAYEVPARMQLRAKGHSWAAQTLRPADATDIRPIKYLVKDNKWHWYWAEGSFAREHSSEHARVVSPDLIRFYGLNEEQASEPLKARHRNEKRLAELGFKQLLPAYRFEAEGNALLGKVKDLEKFATDVVAMAMDPSKENLLHRLNAINRNLFTPTMYFPLTGIAVVAMNAVFCQFATDGHKYALDHKAHQLLTNLLNTSAVGDNWRWTESENSRSPDRAFPAWGSRYNDERLFKVTN